MAAREVDYDPFAKKGPIEVDYDPFNAPAAKGRRTGPKEVDYDPFASTAPVPSGRESVPLPQPRPAQAPGVPVGTATPLEQSVVPEPTTSLGGLNDMGLPQGAPDAERAPTVYTEPSVEASAARSYEGWRSGLSGLRVGANARPLANLDAIEQRLAAGEKPETIRDADDLMGVRWMPPEERKTLRDSLMTSATEASINLAEHEGKRAAIPAHPSAQAVSGAKTFSEAWDALRKDPVNAILHLGAESVVPSAVGGLAAAATGGLGAAVGGSALWGATAGAGLSSYGGEYASEILDSLREAKVDLKDPVAIRDAFNNPKLMEQIYKNAHTKAAVVSALDAVSIPIGGAKILPGAIRPAGIAGRLAEAPASLTVQGGLGAAGEFGGQTAAGEAIKPGAILSEFAGEFVTGPVDVATAAVAKDVDAKPTVDDKGRIVVHAGSTTPPPPSGGAVITADQVAEAVAGVPGLVGTPGEPPAPGGQMLVDVDGTKVPIPTDPQAPAGTVPPTPIASEPGVETTVTVMPGAGRDVVAAQPEGVVVPAPAEEVRSLFNTVQDSGPVRATADRWLSWADRNGFTQDEVSELGLDNYLKSLGPRENITREDVLAHLDGQAITLQEIERRPTVEAAVVPQNWTQYEAGTTPGPREGYVELTMHTPSRVAGATPIAASQVTARVTLRRTPDEQPMALLEEMRPGTVTRQRQSWAALGFNRLIMWAAGRGVRHVAWSDTEEQRELTAVAKRWKKKVGATLVYTKVAGPLGPQRFRALEIPQTGIDYIQAGMPTPSVSVPFTQKESVKVSPFTGHPGISTEDASTIGDALVALIQQIGAKINKPIHVVMHEGDITARWYNEPGTPHVGKWRDETWPNAFGLMSPFGTHYQIDLSLQHHPTPHALWVTMLHELGHVIHVSAYASAPQSVKLALDAAHAKFIQSFKPGATLGDLFKRQQNILNLLTIDAYSVDRTTPIAAMSEKDQIYHLSKSEYFAEQVAKWAMSREKPLSVVEKFFRGVGRKLRQMYILGMKKFGIEVEGVQELQDWLDTLMVGYPKLFAEITAETNNKGTVENGYNMGPEEIPSPPQIETVTGMDGINGIFNGNPPVEAREAKSYADRFTWLHKWMMGVHQVAVQNPHIKSLQAYVGTLQVASQTKQAIMNRAQDILKMWSGLGPTMADNVGQMLDAVQNMDYRTPAEVAANTARLPTLPELQAMAQQFRLSPEGFDVFMEVTKSFQEQLQRVEAMQRAEANKITDATERSIAHAKIDRQMIALRAKPYFPAMRFGNWTITVRNAAGKVIHFETFETKRQRDRVARIVRAQLRGTTDVPQIGFIDRQAQPLLGVPTQLLEQMADKLNLTTIQRDMLEQLKFELSPAQSFRHRFQHKKRTAGYSQDFRRAFATYFLHGANHIVKAMHADTLRELTKIAREEVKQDYDISKRQRIVAYMTDHTQEWLNPAHDWAVLRSIAFLWALAWSPAAAAQNLTQTLTTSYPFLASKFGDVSAIGALINAGRKFENFYRKGYYANQTSFELRAIHKGIEAGIIKESQAPELAGYAEGDMLGWAFGGNALQQGLVRFNELGALMFETAEQVNRRLIFRATLDLAIKNPNSKYVKEAVIKNKLAYDAARADMTEAEAAAYVTAMDATTVTQFQYSRDYAPRFMRGHLRTVFVFKTFIQNYLMFLANYPAAAVRSMLVLGMLGGFMGLPGAEELKRLLQLLAYRLFGKDFDLEKEGRRLIIQLLGEDENGRANAELMMHGLARKGYGIPALMDMIGGTVGVDIPMPTFDRSAAISMGTILPVDLNAMFGEQTANVDATISKQMQSASGAVFGVGFNMFKALANHKVDVNDSKRWERAMPRALASVSKAWRVYNEGAERRADGSKSVVYDVRDSRQLAEVIGMGMGYMPYRQTLEREIDNAEYDAQKTWDIRREGVMRRFGDAVLKGDDKEIAKAQEYLERFNNSLPDHAKTKAVEGSDIKASVKNRATGIARREAGFPAKDSDVPISQDIRKLYPESQRVMRRVKPALTP